MCMCANVEGEKDMCLNAVFEWFFRFLHILQRPSECVVSFNQPEPGLCVCSLLLQAVTTFCSCCRAMPCPLRSPSPALGLLCSLQESALSSLLSYLSGAGAETRQAGNFPSCCPTTAVKLA